MAGAPKDLSNSTPKSEDQWQNLAFPTYLQSEVDDFCQDWDEALQVIMYTSASVRAKMFLCSSKSVLQEGYKITGCTHKKREKIGAC